MGVGVSSVGYTSKKKVVIRKNSVEPLFNIGVKGLVVFKVKSRRVSVLDHLVDYYFRLL